MVRKQQRRLGRAVLSAGVSTLAAVFVASVLLCFGLLGQRMSLFGLVPAVVGTQFLLHLVFSVTGDGVTLGAETAHAGHHGTAAAMTFDVSAVAHHEGMLIAHVVAGLVTVASLRLGAGVIRQVLVSLLLHLRVLLALLLRPLSVRHLGALRGGVGRRCAAPAASS